jgi:hypothetical protein
VDGEAGYRDARASLLRLGGGAGVEPVDDPSPADAAERAAPPAVLDTQVKSA